MLQDTFQRKVVRNASRVLQDEARLCLKLFHPSLVPVFALLGLLLSGKVVHGLQLPNPDVLVLTPTDKIEGVLSELRREMKRFD